MATVGNEVKIGSGGSGGGGGRSDRAGSVDRFLVEVGIVTSIVLLILLLWYTIYVLALIFAGVLLAVLLHGLGKGVGRLTGLPPGWSFAVVVVVLIALTVLTSLFLAPNVSEQLGELFEIVPQGIEKIADRITETGLGRNLLRRVPGGEDGMGALGGALKHAAGIFSSLLGVITGVVIIMFIGLYLAYDPQLYVSGIVRLVPLERRDRARDVLNALGFTLERFLMGRLFAMAMVGAMTWTGLWLLGIPLAMTLALIAALLTFIPYIGPLLSLVPAAMMALTDDPIQVIYVTVLYIGIQSIESYLITPLIQQHEVSLPPALTLVAEAVMGLLLGMLGIILATPFAAVLLVLVKMLYVEDVLGDEIETPGENK